MGIFLTDPDFHPLPNGIDWRVVGELQYQCDSGDIVTAENGFVTDFASVPDALQNIIHRWGKYGWAAAIHDKLYRTNGLGGKYTRHQCDNILWEAMLAKDTSETEMDEIYWGVVAFGQYSWDDDARKLSKSSTV